MAPLNAPVRAGSACPRGLTSIIGNAHARAERGPGDPPQPLDRGLDTQGLYRVRMGMEVQAALQRWCVLIDLNEVAVAFREADGQERLSKTMANRRNGQQRIGRRDP
ncbi:MAG: hypothetical protein AAFR44_05985, partial [Pseudomonadota bacterium]